MALKHLIIGFIAMCITNNVFAQSDTSIAKTDEIINEVVQAKTPDVSKENVEYLSQVTRYGFKNLFRNYTYNPTIPYSQQVNPYAENYMQSYLNSHTSYLHKLQKTGVPYFNLIDGVLSQYGLPHELKYLAVIESDLKANALSSAGARGPWQFMDYTARDYGLKINDQVDERTDYTKSTRAAARYLLSLYKDLNDWMLVIAAYNGGPGRVYSAIKKSGSRNFWKLQYYLPEESRNHVKKFIATHFVMGNGNAGLGTIYGKQKEPEIPDSLKDNLASSMISGRYDAGVIAHTVDMDISVFNALNPDLNTVLSTGEDFKLQLPEDKMKIFENRKYEILNKSVEALINGAIMESRTVYGNKKSG